MRRLDYISAARPAARRSHGSIRTACRYPIG